jgi:CyaY protein
MDDESERHSSGPSHYTRTALSHPPILSSMTPIPEHLSNAEYDALALATFSSVEATVDRLLQDDVIDIDANRTGGLLELTFPERKSVIVINTQPPLHELWLAAPSGGFHFKPVDGRWIDGRDGAEFFAVLSACASELAGFALRFDA